MITITNLPKGKPVKGKIAENKKENKEMALIFQELIFKSSKYWSDYGCIIQQPYDIEKGASTENPATFWRGRSDWNLLIPQWLNPAEDRQTPDTAKTQIVSDIIFNIR